MIFNEIKKQLKDLSIDNKHITAYENFYFSSNINLENKIVNKFNILENLKELYDCNTPEIFRDFYVITSQDIQVLIIQIIHYSNYLKEVKSMNDEDVLQNVQYIKDVYIPISARLGLYNIKSEMEDLSFFILEKLKYKDIAKLLNEKKKDRDKTINSMVHDISTILHNDKYEIYGRSKHIYSIYKKLNEKNKEFNALFDLFAIRIVVPTLNDCYYVLGELNEAFEPLKERFKDYIAKPKVNNYQSIHTVIRNKNNQLFEIQIRTEQMHREAELGVAAHFNYKEKTNIKNSDSTLLESRYSKDYIPSNDLYAITPLKKLLHLQKGDTIIDYAFLIHTQVGIKMVGAIVNSEIKTLNYTIQNGDVIKVLTKKNSMGPNIEWLDMCNSSITKRKIKSYIKKKELSISELAVKEGHKILVKELNKASINSNVLSESKIINRLTRELNYNHISYLYSDVYEKKIKPSEIVKLLKIQKEKNNDIKLSNLIHDSSEEVEVLGAYGIKTDIAKCCHPIFGDEIVAVVKQGDSFKIHKKNCNQIDINKVISARWNVQKKSDTKYLCSMRLITENEDTYGIFAIFAKYKVEIVKLSTSDIGDYKVVNMNVYLTNIEQFNELKANILKNKNVVSFDRI